MFRETVGHVDEAMLRALHGCSPLPGGSMGVTSRPGDLHTNAIGTPFLGAFWHDSAFDPAKPQ